MIEVGIIGFVLFALWGYALYYVGQARKKSTELFWAVYLIPSVPTLLFGIMVLLRFGSVIGFLFYGLFITYVGVLGYALRDASGRKKSAWFVWMLIFPFLFIVYLTTQK